jgi:cell division protein FtsB
MVSRDRIRSIVTGFALYAIAALIIGYFGMNAYTGKYGLNARETLDQESALLRTELAKLKSEREVWTRRVSLLRSEGVDPDMLDERGRQQLNYAHPRDLVRPWPRPEVSPPLNIATQ